MNTVSTFVSGRFRAAASAPAQRLTQVEVGGNAGNFDGVGRQTWRKTCSRSIPDTALYLGNLLAA